MAIEMNNTTRGQQGFWNREGRGGKAVEDANVWLGGAFATGATNTQEYYEGNSTDMMSAVGIYSQQVPISQSALDDYKSQQQTLISDALVLMADEDKRLTRRAEQPAVERLLEDMVSGSHTIQQSEPTVAAASSIVANGNGHVIASIKTTRGLVMQFLLAEEIAADYETGFTFRGQEAAASRLAYDWNTRGSGLTRGVTSIDVDTSAARILNGGFENWTASAPDDWRVGPGTPGTQIVEEVGNQYTGAKCCKWVGDGTAIGLDQPITPPPLTQLAVSFQTKTSAPSSTGILTIDLFDNDGLVTIGDAAGTPNSFTLDVSTLTTSYSAVTGVFRTPAIVPPNTSIRLIFTTPLQSGRDFFTDHVVLPNMTRMGNGAPYVAAITGSEPWVSGDRWDVSVANNYAAKLMTGFGQMFPTAVNNDLFPPFSDTPTIPDSLWTA